MEHTCSELLGRGEIILKPATKITNHIDGKNVTQKDLKGVSKEKHIPPEKCLQIQTKDNPDTSR